MRTERLTFWRRLTLGVYLASFLAPVGKAPGAFIFLAAIPLAALVPWVGVLWLANPLFWFGLAALGRGAWGRAAGFGAGSAAVASLLLPAFDAARFWTGGLAGLLEIAGYFVWLASTWLLAAVSVVAWWAQPEGRPRLQFRIAWVMAVVAVLALVLAAGPAFLNALRPRFSMPMPG